MATLCFSILSKDSREAGRLILEICESNEKKQLRPANKNARNTIDVDVDFLSPTRFSILPRRTHGILTSLAKKHLIFLDDKQIICDFHSKPELYFIVHATGQDSLTTEGKIRFRKDDFSLTDCALLSPGPPHLFIKGASLKFLEADIPWALLQKATLSPEEIESLLEEEDAPSILFPDGSKHRFLQKVRPLPQLQLQDAKGAFASLWMQYEGQKTVAYASPSLPFRKPEEEKAWEADLLETEFVKKQTGNAHYYCPLDKVAHSLSFLLELGWQVYDHQKRRLVKHSASNLTTESSQDTIRIKGTLQFDTHEVNIKEVVGAFERNERFLALDGHSSALLSDPDLQKSLEPLLNEVELVEDGIQLPKMRVGLFDNAENGPIRLDPTLDQLRHYLTSLEEIPTSCPSPEFTGTLRPYQQLGLNWLHLLYQSGFHGILADEMGLGKTVQVLAFLSCLPPESSTIIVCPTSLLFNWKQEIERFLPGSQIYLHHGPARKADSLPTAPFILTSFATLRLDAPLLSSSSFTCLIVDEAQAIKNAHTQTAKAVRQINAQFRLSMTGTPIENSPKEIWSQFHFLMPALLGSQTDFEAQVLAGQSDARYLKQIKRKIAPFILRRAKSEVAQDLPEKIQQTVWIEMAPEQRALYENFLKQFHSRGLRKGNKQRMEIFEAILRLRQICCHPLLVSPDYAPSAKLDALRNDLETIVAEGKKALVFSQFTSMLTLIKKEINDRPWKTLTLDGSTKNREEVVSQFQNDPETSLLFISLKAGGVGLNLTAADYVLLFDPWWNEAIEEQAIARAHRIGRKGSVITKRYLTTATIEEKIAKLKERKQTLASALIDEEFSPSSLTEEDFNYLLSIC